MRSINGVKYIVDGKLASFEYKETGNIIHHLLTVWNDVEYLHQFFKRNQRIIANYPDLSLEYDFEDFIYDVSEGKIDLNKHFIPLSKNS